MKSKVFDHNDVRDTILQAQTITQLTQLATQTTDEFNPETIYHLMRALESILDAAIKRLWAGQA